MAPVFPSPQSLLPVKFLTAFFAGLLLLPGVIALADAKPEGTETLSGPLGFEASFQAPAEAASDWEALRGEVVVLEFWATWCAPCIAEIPHLNDLAERFAGKPVRFIAVTDEPAETVEPFLARKPIDAWIGLDTDRSLFGKFGVRGIPQTVLIGPKGRIAGITHPMELKARHLEDLLAGKDVNFRRPSPPSKAEPNAAAEAGDAQEPLFRVLIRPTEPSNLCASWGKGEISIPSTEVRHILTYAWQVSEKRLNVEGELPEGEFDAIVRIPSEDSDLAWRFLQEALKAAFRLTVTLEPQEVDVYVLTVAESSDIRPEPTVSTGGMSMGLRGGSFQTVNVSPKMLGEWLEEWALDKPVVDETGLTGTYDFSVRWSDERSEIPEPAVLIELVRDQLGLELKAARRTIDIVTVQTQPPPSK